MKRTERILGIIAVSLFVIAISFKFRHWPGNFVMQALSILIFNFGYLPMQLIREGRLVSSFLEKSYLIFRFIALFIVMTGFLFKFQHWPGGGVLLVVSSFLIPLFIAFYFFVRIKGEGKIPFSWNDLFIAVLAYSVHLFVTRTMVSPRVVEGYVILEEQFEKINAGLLSANQLIYASLDSVSKEGKQDLFESIRDLRSESQVLHHLTDSLRTGFIATFYHDPFTQGFNLSTCSRSMLADGNRGEPYFLGTQNGLLLKSGIRSYMEEITRILKTQNLPAGLLGQGFDLADYVTPWGKQLPWEHRMFANIPIASVITNLSWIQQIILLIESATLNGMISQLDLSEETRMLQELASKESSRAIALRENEVVRIRQQQELQEIQLEKSEAELSQSKTVLVFAFAGIAFVLILLTISTRAYMLKQKDNKKLARQKEEITDQKDEIEAQRDEIEAQRDLVSHQKEQIERTHNEISASIDYAMRLQNSILPNDDLLKQHFSDHFVFFRPKQKVSGDFYWWTQVENKVIIAAADCTGHGVPGAFMSLLGVSQLREIVNKELITRPGEILKELREEVIRSLSQKGDTGEQKDGMDMALISISTDTLMCEYAGANSPLYLIRDTRLSEYKPDMMPLSFYQRMDPFTTHKIQLRPGDQLYMFSDGFADQFGGEKRKKFKYKAFKQLLTDNSTSSMDQQHHELSGTITAWQGDHEQIDDMVIIGIKI